MKINHRGIRYFFRGFLVVMLVASIGIALFVHLNADDLFQPPGSRAQQVEKEQQNAPRSVGAGSGRKWSGGPGWSGVVKVTQHESGTSDVTITPVDKDGVVKPLTSFQVYLRNPDSGDEHEVTEKFTKDTDGVLKASLLGTSAEPWSLRIRLHRELSTLEFTHRVDAK